MKHTLKPLLLAAFGALLLAAVHSHVREHQVPHPDTTKVSVTKYVVPPPQLAVVPPVIAITADEHLIAIELVATPGSVAVHEIKQPSCHLRSPPCDNLPPRV